MALIRKRVVLNEKWYGSKEADDHWDHTVYRFNCIIFILFPMYIDSFE